MSANIPQIGNRPDIRAELAHGVLTQAEFDSQALHHAYDIVSSGGKSYAAEFLTNLPPAQLNTYAAILFATCERFRNHFAARYQHSIVAEVVAAQAREARSGDTQDG